jgi:hypothetical protein
MDDSFEVKLMVCFSMGGSKFMRDLEYGPISVFVKNKSDYDALIESKIGCQYIKVVE